MFKEHIANVWTQLIAKMAAPRFSAPQVTPEHGSSKLRGECVDDDANSQEATKPYAPSNSERVSESSLHFSC